MVKISDLFQESLSEFIEEKMKDNNINKKVIDEQKIFEKIEKHNNKLLESFNSLSVSDKAELPEEMWRTFSKSLQLCSLNPYFINESKKVKAKILTKNFFNRFLSKEKPDLEQILKVEIKDYYRKFTSEDIFEFAHTIFKLPFSFQELVISYCESKNEEYKNHIKITAEELKSFIEKVKLEKAKLIINVNDVSLGKSGILKLSSLKSLFDVDAFNGNTALDLAVIEYFNRLIFNESACERIKEQYGYELVDYMKDKISRYTNYINFLKKVKSGKLQPFFDSKGIQREKGLNYYLKSSQKQ